MLTVLNVYANTAIMPKGKGTKEEPFLIERWENLYWMSVPNTINGISYQQKMEKYYVQTADISFPKNIGRTDKGIGWIPIGTVYSDNWRLYSFKGSYNGQNYKIDGLYSGCDYEAGLFGKVLNAELKNIHLTNVMVAGESHIGALAGSVFYDSSLTPKFKNTIENCSSTGKIVGDEIAGGLIGSVSGYKLINCYSKCDIDIKGYYVGGLIGEAESTQLINCYTISNVSGDLYIGGIAGIFSGKMNNCFSNGKVNAKSKAGGLLGEVRNNIEIENSYSLSVVKADEKAGGLFPPHEEYYYVILYNSYYKLSNNLIKGKIVRTEGALEDLEFENWLRNGKKTKHLMLKKNDKGEYLISSVNDLKLINSIKQDKDNKFILLNNLDLSNEKDFYIPFFRGTFDGNHKSIQNLTINLPDQNNIALFSRTENAYIKNLQLINVSITANDKGAALIGTANGRTLISDCSVSGTIKGNKVAGLLGLSNTVTVLKKCHVKGTVKGKEAAAGIVLYYCELLSDCVNESDVYSEESAAGLVHTIDYSKSTPTIVNCVNKGNIHAKNSAGIGLIFDGEILKTYNSGRISGVESASGLIGSSIYKGMIHYEDCYNIGLIVSENSAAGIQLGGCFEIKNCHNSGNIKGKSYVGGLVSIGQGSIIDSYNEGDIEAESLYGGLISCMKMYGEDYDAYNNDDENYGYPNMVVINSYYNYEKVKFNGKSEITYGALDQEMYENWGTEAKILHIMDYLVADEQGNFQIWDMEDFKKLLAFGYYRSENFILMNDIDFKDDPNFYIPGFNSNLNGNGKTIRNLNLNLPNLNNIGLFGYGQFNSVCNLKFENARVTGRDITGLLCGYSRECVYENLSGEGTVKSNGTAGGLLGELVSGRIIKGSFKGDIQAKKWAGGLIGVGAYTEVEECHVNAKIENHFIEKYNIIQNEDLIPIETYASGGIIGYQLSTKLKNSFAVVNMDSQLCGGISGIFSLSSISDSYSICKLSEQSKTSGLIAVKQLFTEQFYEQFQSEQLPEEYTQRISHSFMNKDLLSVSSIEYGTLISSSELKNQSLLIKAGWDFRNVWNIDPQVNEGYPVFKHRSE